MAKLVRTNEAGSVANYDVFTDATKATSLGKVVSDWSDKKNSKHTATKPDGTTKSFTGFVGSRAAIGWLMGREAPAPKPKAEAKPSKAKPAKASPKGGEVVLDRAA